MIKLQGSVAIYLRYGGGCCNQIKKGLELSLPLKKIKIGKYLAELLLLLLFFTPGSEDPRGLKTKKATIKMSDGHRSGRSTGRVLLLLLFFDPGTQFPGNEKITLCNTKKYKNQAGMNLTPPPPSQNSHAVRWHCTAESERRVAEIKS